MSKQKASLKLSKAKMPMNKGFVEVRSWVCPICGVCHDRDLNASQNILAAGLVAAACGGALRPVGSKGSGAGTDETGRLSDNAEKPLPF